MSGAGERRTTWGPWSIATGGTLMASLWIVFTSIHGATSVNEGRLALGRDMHFWGLLMSVVPSVLIAAGLIVLRSRLTGGRRLAEVGHTVVAAGLLATAALDLVFRALGPPLFLPVVGIGLVLMAAGNRGSQVGTACRALLWVLGLLLLGATAWALVPLEYSDSIGGFRIFGAAAYFASGLTWAAFGATLSAARVPASTGPVHESR